LASPNSALLRFFCTSKILSFISFAPPKEMNQRKRGRKRQLQPCPRPATQALLALRSWLKFAPFPVPLHTPITRFEHIHKTPLLLCGISPKGVRKISSDNWVSNGLREFWEKATVLKLAAKACCKQYCLRPDLLESGRVVLRGQASKQEPQNYLQP
jgi:hypothetical protein